MSEQENLVTEQVAENVEQTTEEKPKIYTEDDFNAKLDEVLGKKIARKEAKIRREYEEKYNGLTGVLKAGTGKESVEEMTDTFTEFYRNKGIKIPEKPVYTAKEIEVLAEAEAADIISGGFDEVVEEVDRLAAKGATNMTAKEKAVFKTLAEYRQNAERGKELSKIGVTEDVYNSQEFKDFARKFTSDTPIRDVYDIYRQTKPKKEHKTMGSMKNTEVADTGLKDFYSYEEAMKFTKKDFDKNPELYKRVQESMTKWK